MFTIEWSLGAIGGMQRLKVFHRKNIRDSVVRNLTHDANVFAGVRKQIFDLRPPWSNTDEPFWQLKVVPYRVFYDIIGATVRIQAIRLKPQGKNTKDIL